MAREESNQSIRAKLQKKDYVTLQLIFRYALPNSILSTILPFVLGLILGPENRSWQQVFLLTLPLSVSLTFLGVLLLQGELPKGHNGLYGLAVVALVLAVGFILGKLLGLLVEPEPPNTVQSPGTLVFPPDPLEPLPDLLEDLLKWLLQAPPVRLAIHSIHWIFLILSSYWKIYGWRLFVASFLVSGVTAWRINEWLNKQVNAGVRGEDE